MKGDRDRRERRDVGAIVAMGVVVLLATLAVHGLAHSLLRDFSDAGAGELLALYGLWLVPLGYSAFTMRAAAGRRSRPAAGPFWPWAVTAGLVAASILVASCFAVVFA